MFKSYMRQTFRNLGKHKVYSIIKILGLAVGLAVTIMIFLFMKNELSYDRFHKNADNLYRVYANFYREDGRLSGRSRGVALPMGPVMEEYFPEITHSFRIMEKPATIKVNGNLYNEKITMVDKPFFQAFSFPLLMGDSASVFAQPNSMVLTRNHAQKFFGETNPIGKNLTLIFGQNRYDFVITGIAANAPSNSSIKFDMLVDMETVKALKIDRNFDNWAAFGFQNYILVKDRKSVDSLKQRFPAFTQQYYGPLIEKRKEKGTISFGLQKITRVHLDPRIKGYLNLSTILILSGLALIVLLIASINFMNLSVAQASTRSLEVGMRKVMGAERKQLVHQFWGESLIITCIALLVGIVLTALVLPTFNQLARTDLNLKGVFEITGILALLVLTAIVGIASGSYPALVMSRFAPVGILRGNLKIRGKNPLTRILVVIQFTLSIFLIIATIILGRQLNLMLTKDPGFNKKNIVAIRSQEPNAEESNNILKHLRDRLNQEPNILAISGVCFPIGDPAGYTFKTEDGREIEAFQNRIDYDFFKTLNIKVIQGRTFAPEFPTDKECVVVTERLVKELDIKNPIGKQLKGYSKPLTIIGIVKDYHIESFRRGITPALHHMNPAWPIAYIVVHISPDNFSHTISLLEKTWNELQPYKPFNYSFLDEEMESMYREEKRWQAILGYSSVLAIIIACMGIFALTSITVNQRTKEIGIRKVMGANISQIIHLVQKEFLWLVAMANIISWPLAYYASRMLLKNYYYRIPIGLHYFLIAGLLSFAIALTTIIFLAARAATANPVDSLKYE